MNLRGVFYDLVNRYHHALVGMVMQSTACNEQRLARWLLLAQDRVEANDFPMTQEFLAMMLGASRPTVTVVAGTLQKAGRRGEYAVTLRASRVLESAPRVSNPVRRAIKSRCGTNMAVQMFSPQESERCDRWSPQHREQERRIRRDAEVSYTDEPLPRHSLCCQRSRSWRNRASSAVKPA
jgi:hypothetical protein